MRYTVWVGGIEVNSHYLNKVKSEYDEISETEELINLHHEYQEL